MSTWPDATMVKADKKLVLWLVASWCYKKTSSLVRLDPDQGNLLLSKTFISQERNSAEDRDNPIKLMNSQKSENSVDRQKNGFQLIGDFLTSRLKAGEVLSTDLSQLPLGFVEVHGNRQRRLGSNSQWLLHKVGPRGKL